MGAERVPFECQGGAVAAALEQNEHEERQIEEQTAQPTATDSKQRNRQHSKHAQSKLAIASAANAFETTCTPTPRRRWQARLTFQRQPRTATAQKVWPRTVLPGRPPTQPRSARRVAQWQRLGGASVLWHTRPWPGLRASAAPRTALWAVPRSRCGQTGRTQLDVAQEVRYARKV